MDLKNIPGPESWLIFTDLDGTLLDHHSYSHRAAEAALYKLKKCGTPVILNSSKTLKELENIARQLDLNTPLIAENGSLIYDPADQSIQNLGADYNVICSFLDQLRAQENFRFHGFHDWSMTEIARRTGLNLQEAEYAAQKQASEPLIWEDRPDRIEDFRVRLREKKLKLVRGGRFWHVMGLTDKVSAMNYLRKKYQQRMSRKPFVIALGDSANDSEMLAAADIAIIVHNPEGSAFSLTSVDGAAPRKIIKTTLSGPAGWNEAILSLLPPVNDSSTR